MPVNFFTLLSPLPKPRKPPKVNWRKVLAFAHVPHGICEHLREHLGEGDLFDYGFRFVSHLLAHVMDEGYSTKGLPVPQDARLFLAKVKSPNTLKQRTDKLIAAGVIEVVKESDWWPDRLATTYRVPQALIDLWLADRSNKNYLEPSDFKRRVCRRQDSGAANGQHSGAATALVAA